MTLRFFTGLVEVSRSNRCAPLQKCPQTSLAIGGIPIVQIALLVRDGQTIGKKIVSIRIVSVETGQNAGFGSNVVMRAWVNSLLSTIPFCAFVDILFIFRDDQRCIHDLIAGTHVVE